MNLFLYGIILPSFVFGLDISCDKVVTLPQGRVRGMYHQSKIIKFRTYLGIPYASVTQRYQDPGDPPTWNGTFNAITESTCKQFSEVKKEITGTEDCLTVNVFTPCGGAFKPLPVIVFIHGGSYYYGSNTRKLYDPIIMVNRNVIVATINYRLGAFGFLCLRTPGAPGNVGLKDQIAALRWVKNNIAQFGGNPKSVTLFGQSSGANSVMTLLLTQAATGLFHRVIVDSGTVNSPQFFDRHPIKSAVEVAGHLGYSTTDTEELLEIFKNSTADDIVSASYVDSTNNALAPYVLQLCKEDPKVSRNAVITENPQKLINKATEISNISIIMGFNDQEGIMWATDYDLNGLKSLYDNISSAIPRSFEFKSNERKESFHNDVKKFYFPKSRGNYQGLIDYYSDSLIMYPSVLTMEAFARNPKITMYNYYFKYDSRRNLGKMSSRLKNTPGADHMDELYYLFDPLELKWQREHDIQGIKIQLDVDLKFTLSMTSLWTSFAETGVPSARYIEWMPSREKDLRFLMLNKESKMIGLPNKHRIDFWRSSEKKYGQFYP